MTSVAPEWGCIPKRTQKLRSRTEGVTARPLAEGSFVSFSQPCQKGAGAFPSTVKKWDAPVLGTRRQHGHWGRKRLASKPMDAFGTQSPMHVWGL